MTVLVTDWEADCMEWRGRILDGNDAHWCPDWDDLPIDSTCEEYPCYCFDAPSRLRSPIKPAYEISF